MGRVVLGLVVIACAIACGACAKGPPRPLSEAIVGEWDVWCRTDTEASSACLGQERDGLMKRFEAGGKVSIGVRGQTTTTDGTWRLEGGLLVLEVSAGAIALTERYRARIEDDRLILWGDTNSFGTVHGRAGATFVPAKSRASTPPETRHTIGGAAYRLGLPGGYRLARDDNDRQVWEPASGGGLSVRLKAIDREAGTPCDRGGEVRSSRTVGGVERQVSISIVACRDDRKAAVHCSVEHTRGHLEASDEAGARALCASLVLD